MHPNKTQNSRLFLITYSCMSLTDTQHFRNMKLFFSSPHSNFPCSGWQGWDEMDQGSLDANSEIFHSGYRGRFSKLAFHNPNTPISLWGQHNSKPKQQRKSQPSFNSKPDKLNCMSSNKNWYSSYISLIHGCRPLNDCLIWWQSSCLNSTAMLQFGSQCEI